MQIEIEKHRIISGLQKMPENQVTQKIIIPLLECLGFHKVEFFGGVAEEGKDILCWEIDRTGDLKLTVAQVKHFKFSNKASDSKSLQTVFNQLTTCFKKSLPYTDQSIHLPKEAYLISTHIVDTKSLQTRFGAYPDLQDSKVKIIDGLKLATLLIKHMPHLIKNLIGLDIEISSALNETLNNEILLKALGYTKSKDIRSIYIDIDFSIGKITTELFFNGILRPVNLTVVLSEVEWDHFKLLCSELAGVFPLTFLSNSFEEIEEENKNNRLNHQTWKKKVEQLTENLNSLKNNFSNDNEEINELNRKIINLKKEEPKLNYTITLNGFDLFDKIHQKRKWIESKVKEFNKQEPSIPKIKEFIEESKRIIDCASIFFNYPQFFSCIGFDKSKIIRNDFDSTRFKLPIQHIFETGLHIAVLGEAGAGKSTSLQMYALSGEDKINKLLICVPLANVTQNWLKSDPDLTNEMRIKRFDEAIVKYLQQKGISITQQQFNLELTEKNSVLLLDGIDEAIKLNPWLPKGVAYLATKYNSKIQVIVTSRMSGSYINEIPFFAVTLLPFTEEQRNTFIEKWFAKEEKEIVLKIQTHLKKNKAISDAIRNPLLTTTLCVLAKNDIDLPNTEIKLYTDRLKLLTGYYDRVKNIDVRVSLTPQTLETIAQKIAFYLHSEAKREEDMETLKKQAIKLTLGAMSTKDAETAIDELIEPCNILVPMTDDGKFGFGHLRYQEHLVAKEIASNRSIVILPLIKQSWWRGPLTLFSQMNADLEWLVKEVGERSNILGVKEGLYEMIKVRSKKDRHNLKGLIDSYLILERMESANEDETNL